MKKSFVTLTTVTLIFLMVFTIHPQVVFADDGTPTSDESTPIEETPPPVETVEETETISETEQGEVVDQTSADGATEEPEVVSTPEQDAATSEPLVTPQETLEAPTQNEITTEQPEESSEEPTPSVSEMLEQAPEGTQLVVLDSEGQVEPLASQEAADIVVSGDPMWCPGTTLPGGLGCTPSYDTFEKLLAELIAVPGTYSGDGTIYVADDYDTIPLELEPDDIIIDGFTFTDLGALTIQGGWDFTGGTIVGTSTFTKSLDIKNWGGQVTINDVIFNATNGGLAINTSGAVSLSNVQSTGTVFSDGIAVTAGGDVDFSDVTSTSSKYSGAIINSGGSVSVQNSAFNNNGTGGAFGLGLDITATGEIDISNTDATGNPEGGARLESNNNISVAGADVSNNTSGTDGYGIHAISGGNVTLSSVIANSNNEFGALIDSQGSVSVGNSSFSGNQYGEGLIVDANGTVTLNSVTASNNVFYGAIVTATDNVTITNSTFSGNTGTGFNAGLEIKSPGTIHLSSVSADNNANDGIAIYDGNTIVLNDVNALNNGWNGVYVETNCANVQVLGGSYSNNGYYGMEVSTGRVKISGTQFTNNTLGYISVENGGCFFIPARGPVFIYNPPDVVLPWNILSVDGDDPINLDCDFYIGTILILENGDRIKLPCPIQSFGSLSRVSAQNLPGALPEGYQYLSGMESKIVLSVLGGTPLEILNTAITISFRSDDINSNLAILYWDGSQWQDLVSFGNQGGVVYSSDQLLYWDGNDWTDVIPDDKRFVGQAGYKTPDGYFESVLNFTGIFILAEKTN